MNTILVACFGALSAAIVSWFGPTKRPEPDVIANELLGGLVGVTAGCACVSTFGAAMIGLTSGALLLFDMLFIEEALKLDDVVRTIAVHGFEGVWGIALRSGFLSASASAGRRYLYRATRHSRHWCIDLCFLVFRLWLLGLEDRKALYSTSSN